MAWYHDYGFFPPSQPREAKGGIKAQSKRGGFGQNWWAKRWIEVIESFNLGARLTRGRVYARKGQVVSIDIEKGRISAKVQGSRAKPYSVVMKVKSLSANEWTTVAEALKKEALFAAALLSGQMPEHIEGVFKKAKLSLFPSERGDFSTECSCPDWSNPCKHIAAVYYLIAEEFDRDPFLIFRLRGVGRDEFLDMLGDVENDTGDGLVSSAGVGELETAEPLQSDPVRFWGQCEEQFQLGEVAVPAISAGLPRRLGGFPFWRGNDDFLASMIETYEGATNTGLNFFVTGKQEL